MPDIVFISRLILKTCFTVSSKTKGKENRVSEKVRFRVSGKRSIDLERSDRKDRERLFCFLFTLNRWSVSCKRPTWTIVVCSEGRGPGSPGTNQTRIYSRIYIHRTYGAWCISWFSHTHVNNCRAPMRGTLLKAEKWTKNRYIALTEFPNLVFQLDFVSVQPVRVI